MFDLAVSGAPVLPECVLAGGQLAEARCAGGAEEGAGPDPVHRREAAPRAGSDRFGGPPRNVRSGAGVRGGSAAWSESDA